MTDKEREDLPRKYLSQACRDFCLQWLPKHFPIFLGISAIVLAPFLISSCYGAGWGLVADIVAIAIWVCGIKLWFFPTIRLIWFIILVLFLAFAGIEIAQLYRH